jgi:hypothetical protein
MSRRRPVDNSATVSLFPFLAVLLCTMGALLVVLVAVSRSARNSALVRAASLQTATIVEEDPAARAELEKVDAYVAKLQKVRGEVEKKLREDQLRLGQLENHMRSLQDQLQKLVLAAAELDALEEEHYDDRKQAEREVARLNGLIAEAQAAIDELKQSGTKRRSYALLPYEGPNGTFRRPIYMECTKDGVTLQPEGVLITRDDLEPPLGSGNALAAAMRAARDHYVQLRPEEGQTRDAEPYAMLLVRPGGEVMFAGARRAVEAGDFDFGFEPVEKDWKLNFGAPDPQLANVEQQAIEQARARQTLLAAAAPRAYRNRQMASRGQFDFEHEVDDPLGLTTKRTGRIEGQPAIVVPGANLSSGDGASIGSTSTADGGEGNGDGESVDKADDGAPPDGTAFSRDAERSASGQPDTNGNVAASSSASAASAPSDRSGNTGSGNYDEQANSAADANGASARSVSNMPSDQRSSTVNEFDPHQNVVPKWDAPERSAKAVAVRRMIRVVVRESQLGIMSDESSSKRPNLSGKTIAFEGDTVESLDEFVKAMQEQVESWGIAGDGLYWRPVLELHVGPDGQRRADDLQRLLKNSDIEVILPTTATNSSQRSSRATH